MADFVHLHTHSHFTLPESTSAKSSLVAAAQSANMPALALTDRGGLMGALNFKMPAAKRD